MENRKIENGVLIFAIIITIPLSIVLGYNFAAISGALHSENDRFPSGPLSVSPPAGFEQISHDYYSSRYRALSEDYRNACIWRGIEVIAAFALLYPIIGRLCSALVSFLCNGIDWMFRLEESGCGRWSAGAHLWFAVFWPILILPTLAIMIVGVVYFALFRSLFDPNPPKCEVASSVQTTSILKTNFPEL